MNLKLSAFFTFLVIFLAIPALAADRYVDNLDGTVTDNFTQLVWIKDPNIVPELTGQKDYQAAYTACEELVFAGRGPKVWSLPRIDELKSIMDPGTKNPRIDSTVFAANSAPYWSQTSFSPGSRAWTLNFKNGALGGYDKSNPEKPALHYLRCVTKNTK